MIEGLGEGMALLVKIVSGPWSDRLRRRKILVLIGYSMGALSKPLFALAGSPGVALGARLFDRVGKGIRGAPRDALVADIAPKEIRGRAFGLRQALDTSGAVIGPLLAVGLMMLLHDDFRRIFWIALIPGMISVALILWGVKEPERATVAIGRISRQFVHFGRPFWVVCVSGAMLQFARFSEAFLILRARDFGIPFAYAPLVLVVMNVVYAAGAYPLGGLSDRIGRKKVMAAGFGCLVISELLAGSAVDLAGVLAAAAFWGIHLALTQGVLAALVADTSPEEYRGTAYGVFYFSSAIALLLGSPLAGLVWDAKGAAATYYAGAGIAAFGLTLFLILFDERPHGT